MLTYKTNVSTKVQYKKLWKIIFGFVTKANKKKSSSLSSILIITTGP